MPTALASTVFSSLSRIIAPALGSVVLAGVASAQTAPAFTLELLAGSSAAINDNNQITLVRQPAPNRYVGGIYNLDTGAFRPLTTALPEVYLSDISDNGRVAGTLRAATGPRSIVSWTPAGVRATIRPAVNSVITGPFINPSGRVVWGDGPTGYSWINGARVTSNASLNSLSRTMHDLTDDNRVVGMAASRATLASVTGGLVALPTSDSTWSEAIESNQRGEFLISAATPAGLQQRIWNQSTGVSTLLVDSAHGRLMTMSRAMNDVGDVVGAGIVPGLVIPDAVLWTQGTAYSFKELLGGDYPAGWTGFLMPIDINNNGIILGIGTYQGSWRWFVMRPVSAWNPG